MERGVFTRRLALIVLCVAALMLACDQDEADSAGSDERSLRGREISPVPLDITDKDLGVVGLGSYIVNAQGACNDCHTCPQFEPGHDPHQGQPFRVNAANYLAGGREFGPVVASNLTPDAQGRPGGLTRQEFIRTMRTGRDPDEPERILQVMPWHVYGQMTDHDLSAIYEYLSTIPQASPGVCEEGG